MLPKNICISCMEEKGDVKTCPHCGYNMSDEVEASIFLNPGTVLAGKYMIGKVLGQGGFGITYLAWDINLDIRIAVKEFFPQGLVSRLPGKNTVASYTGTGKDQFSSGAESFLKEAKTLARFENHPNIVTVRDFFKENGTAYMVMSYLEGLTLEAYLAQEGGKINIAKAISIIMPVMDALKEVHEAGIMHRDISPDNIYIDKKGRVVLIDFGASRQEMREKSKSFSVILKAGYAPEEQYRSRGKQGPWTDVYSVAATMYRSITGEVPLDALDRMAEDTLVPPSQLDVDIDIYAEQVLLKAIAVKVENRYQSIAEFQNCLLKGKRLESVKAIEPLNGSVSEVNKHLISDEETKACHYCGEQIKAKAKVCKHCKTVLNTEEVEEQDSFSNEPEKKPGSAKKLKYGLIIILCVLIFVALAVFSSRDYAAGPAEFVLDADYFIDYENGDIPIGDLPLGARVVDPSWEWEFRTGPDYTREENNFTKPVTWIVVAKDHYDSMEPHVTLLSEELIGRFLFDNSTYRHTWGYNHWGESGTHSSATSGLRPWLNSTGSYYGEGFYQAFSVSLRSAVISTTLPNNVYYTSDNVFIPSTTELGDITHSRTYSIGSVYPYFEGEGSSKRLARLDSVASWYWTRSPHSELLSHVSSIYDGGGFYGSNFSTSVNGGVRPALNLKADTLVSEIRK